MPHRPQPQPIRKEREAERDENQLVCAVNRQTETGDINFRDINNKQRKRAIESERFVYLGFGG